MKYLIVLLGYCIPFLLQADDAWHQLHLYMWAQYNQLHQHFDRSAQAYQHLIPSKNQYIYTGYLSYLYQTNQFAKIISLVPTLDYHIQNYKDNQLILIQSLQHINHGDKAHLLLLKLVCQHPTNSDVVLLTLQSLVQMQHYQQALSIIDTFLEQTQDVARKNFVFYFIKAQIFLQQNLLDKALENIQKSLDLQPNFDQGWLIGGMIQEQQKRLPQALEYYTHYLSLIGTHNAMEQHIKQLQTVVALEKKQSSAKLNELLATRSYQAASNLLLSLITPQAPWEEKKLLIKLLAKANTMDLLHERIQGWIKQDKKMVMPLLYSILKNHFDSSLFELFQEHATELAQQLLVLHLSLKNNLDAQVRLTMIDRLLSTVQEPKARAQLWYYQALSLYQQKKWQECTNALRQGLREFQHYLPLINLEAYYAIRNAHYDYAHNLIKVLEYHDPYNNSYNDTKAYLYYKQKDYRNALSILAGLPHSNYYTCKHCAKTLYALNRVEQAHHMLTAALHHTEQEHQQLKIKSLLKKWTLNE